MVPVILGGIAMFGAGFVARKYYDENHVEIDDKIEKGLKGIQDWFDSKAETLDDYFGTKQEKKKYQVEEEINFENLQLMKKRVYNDSFLKFTSIYEKIDNSTLGELTFQELKFNTQNSGDEIFQDSVQNNIQIAINLLFKANDLLSEMNINLDEIIKEENNYDNFRSKEKELLQEAFSLAKFLENVCKNYTITEDVVIRFSEIILSFQKEK